MNQAAQTKYTAVIGLEVHAQLLTRSKIFSSDASVFGRSPNTNVSVITIAHPGTLPKVNKHAIISAVKMGLACNSEISRYNIFDRKNYFYPDLPKGYQLTQDRTPLCKGGSIPVRTKNGERDIRLNRIHLEEDAGKLLHLENDGDSLVDLNRAGVALIEIVTEPVIESSEEAGALMAEIRKIVRYLGICDGNMEEGSLRCDANVSVRPANSKTLGKKVEVKNMNSIRNVQRAIDHEILRQITLLEQGEKVVSETRLFDTASGKTLAMRTKEELNDYRYFPDPDLSPLTITEEWISAIRSEMPTLPRQLEKKYITQYQIPEYDAQVLTDSRDIAMYFEEVCALTSNYKAVSNWIMGPVKSYLNDKNITANDFPVKPKTLADLILLVDQGKVSYTVAYQRLFPELIRNNDLSPEDLAKKLNVTQVSSSETILPIIEEVIREFPLKVEEYKNGKKGIVTMFMGEVMKRSKGKADPKVAAELLNRKLAEA